MLFNVICAILALIVAGALLRPMTRPRQETAGDAEDQKSGDVAFYKSQLKELTRDLERGVISAEEAARARAEIARRLLAADRAPVADTGRAPPRVSTAAAVVIGAGIILGGAGLYRWAGAPGYPDQPLKLRLAASEEARANRLSQADMAAKIPPSPPVDLPADYAEMVARLRDVAGQRPDDLQGQRLLARHEAQLGQYDAAIAAQRNVLRILGDEARPDDRLLLLDLMVFQTRGYVSHEAEAIAREILEEAPENIGARYYIGLLYDGTDRPDVAFRLWREIVESGSMGPHAEMARRMIEQAADRAGMRYALPQMPAPQIPGPSAEEMAAASEMDPEARDEMIRGMVTRLNNRLANQGGTAEEWARLIGALGVLEETAQAQAIWNEAQQRFAERPEELDMVRAAAENAGLE